ncbi:hypothetical protein ACWD01_33480 [Streptomyces sp. NPDC002835]
MKPNLPLAVEQQLRSVGRQVWMAEVGGFGRERWPEYFADSRPTAYSRVRIQAAIARREGGDVVVHLVWAGADPSGHYADGRRAMVRFSHEGGSKWTPRR